MKLSYKLIDDGYEIYIEGQSKAWIGQGGKYGTFFPYSVLNDDNSINYEESAKAHIEAITQSQTAAQSQLDKIEAATAYIAMMLE